MVDIVEDSCLWYRDYSSDKVWGIVQANGSPVSYWGRRGKELSFKVLTDRKAATLMKNKIAKGYREVQYADLGPDFESDMMMKLTLFLLSGK